MTFTLRDLPFSADDIGGFLSSETLAYHHGKHHAAYVNNLNSLVKEGEFASTGLFEIIQKSSGGVFNNAAQVFNHDFYWDCLSPCCKPIPSDLLAAINERFGSVDSFKEAFLKAAATLFGSGWAWLVLDNGRLEIIQTSNASTPLCANQIPLLVCDVWEHAYYVDFRNARPSYLEKFWNAINWDFVAQNYDSARKDGIESTKRYIATFHA